MTRDIISPVKQATDGLPSIVKDIEDIIVSRELVPLMEDFYKDEMLYFTSDEFQNRILVDGKIEHVSFEDLNTKYNSDDFNPVDGKMVRLADQYSALLEADSSIRYGITSKQIEDGRMNLIKAYPFGTWINGIDAFKLFDSFNADKDGQRLFVF